MDPDETYDLIMRFREAGATSVSVGSVSVHWPASPLLPSEADAKPSVSERPPTLAEAAKKQGLGPPTFPTRIE